MRLPAAARRRQLLGVALDIFGERGFHATSMNDLAEAAGVTKGGFFHHFKSKEDLAVSAANFWAEMTGQFFAGAPYHHHADPLDRVLGYIDGASGGPGDDVPP